MKKLLIIVISIVLFVIVIWNLSYIESKRLISNIDVYNTHINFIRSGSGDLIETNESLEVLTINSLSNLNYRQTINLLPRGGWSFMIELNYLNKDYVIVISEAGWMKVDGKRYQVEKNKDWEDLITSLSQ